MHCSTSLPTCPPFTQAVLQYPCSATHRFFNTKPFDYSIHNREICSCLCETAPSSEPYFISDIKGRLLARSSCCRRPHRIFPWSNYLLNLTRNCGQKHYRINVSNIPRYFTKSRLKKVQPPPPANFVGTSEFGTCDCTDHLAKKLETDPMLLDIDPYLTPIQLQLEIGLRKLRKIQPPTIWIIGHAHETTIRERETFARSLAAILDYTYINMDTEIWKRTEASSEELTNINNEFARKGDHVGKSAHSRLVVMSWKLTSNPSVTLSEEGVLEMLKLILVHNANGFVIDSFPCNEIEASGFEAMFYPVTFSIYIRPPAMKRYKPRSKNATRPNDNNDGHKKIETRASYESVLEPSNFRRSHSYHEVEVQNIAHKYKDQLRALIFDHGIDLGHHEAELASALILEELSRKTKEKEDFLQIHHPPANYHDMVGLAKCYNPYCDCHILEDETKNPLLARDEQAMDHIIQRMRADQEEFRPSLLRLLDQRDQKEGSYQLREDNSVTRNMQEDDADEIFGGAWTEASSTTQEDFTPKFRFHEVSSGQIGHGHHSDHHALRDICSRGRLFEWDESSVQFLLKPNNKATAGQPPSDVNDRGGIVSKIGWGINDITTDDETSEAASFEYKLIDHPKLVGDDDDEFLEDVGDEDDQDYDDDDNSGEEEVLENSEDEENDDNNDVPAGVNQNVHAQHNDDVDEEARQRTSGGGDGGRPPPQH